MTIFGRGASRRDDPGKPALRYEYCCGAECDSECRRQALREEFLRISPSRGIRLG
jgi:hypothetical protein